MCVVESMRGFVGTGYGPVRTDGATLGAVGYVGAMVTWGLLVLARRVVGVGEVRVKQNGKGVICSVEKRFDGVSFHTKNMSNKTSTKRVT